MLRPGLIHDNETNSTDNDTIITDCIILRMGGEPCLKGACQAREG